MKKILLIALLSSLCYALEPKNDCIMPAVPLKISSNREIDALNNAADSYRACIDTFIAAHRANIKSSMSSMESAGHDWSQFVRLMNNSPAYQKHVRPESKSVIPIQAETSPAPFGSHNVGNSDPTKIKANFSF